ncbi:MAG: hypothetical protein KGS47_14675 [Chloroflexi bacterium]|nr:hypothetical protein [Chloroflexota bacterium]
MAIPEEMIGDRFRVIYAITESPTGRLVRGRDLRDDRLVLVALLPIDSTTQADTARLAGEVAAVRHASLVPLREHFADGAQYVLVCDDPAGRDLAQRAERGAPDAAEAIGWLIDVLGAAAALHAHRPALTLGAPEPADIWFTADGAVRLLPFAAVRSLGSAPAPWLAPELAEGEPTEASDIYALSALWFLLLTGQAPPAANLAGGPPALRGVAPHVSPLVEQALMRGLQPRVVNRYQSAREMRVACETVRTLGERSLGFVGPDAAAVAPPEPAATVAPATPPAAAPPPQAGAVAVPAVEVPAAAPAQTVGRPRASIPTGCLVALAVGLVIIALGLCLVTALLLAPQSPLPRLLGYTSPFAALQPTAAATAAPTVAAPTSAPATSVPAAPTPTGIALGADAITLTNAATITQTAAIDGSLVGPTAFSPDGATIAIGISGEVRLFDSATLSETVRLSGHRGRVTSLAWSRDGTRLVTGASDDGRILVWRTADRTVEQTLVGHEGWIRSLDIAPDGSFIVSGSTDGTVRVWNTSDWSVRHVLTGHTGYIGGVAVSPDSRLIASGGRDGAIRLWDATTGAAVAGFAFQTALTPDGVTRYWTTGVRFSPDGRTIAVGSTDGTVSLLDAASGATRQTLRGHTNWVVIRGLEFTPDGATLYSAGLDGTIRRWAVADGSAAGVLEQHQMGVFSIALAPDGQRLVSASDQEGRVLLWSTADDSIVGSALVGQGLITGIVFSPDSRAVVLTGYNGVLQLRILADGSNSLLPGSPVASQPFAFLPNGRFIALDEQGRVAVIDIANQQSGLLSGAPGTPLSVAASPTGALVAVGDSGGAVTVWNQTGPQGQTLPANDLGAVTLLAFSGDGRYLAAVGPAANPRIALYDVTTSQLLRTLQGGDAAITAVAFQPGSAVLATTSFDGVVRFWNAGDGVIARTIAAPAAEGWFAGIAFSPDGSLLAASSAAGTVMVYDAGTGALVAEHALEFSLTAISFSPDGSLLAVGSHDNSVRILAQPR